MPTLQDLKQLRPKILEIGEKHGAKNICIFGSVARGDAGPESDVDFLVEMEAGRSLFDLGGFLVDLEDLLKCRVDVVTEKGLRPNLKVQVLKEVVTL